MKTIYLIVLCSCFITTANTQITENKFYYLKKPVSDIFGITYTKPSGENDPSGVPSATFEETDIVVRKSVKQQYFNISDNKSQNYLFGTFVKNKNLSVVGKFFNVRNVILSSNGWQKISDNGYHAVEALRADSVVFTIKTTGDKNIGSAAIEKIAKLFIGGTTAVGMVLNAFGSTDTTQAKSGGILSLKSTSKDSITFTINDNTVYYAVRYAMVTNAKDLFNTLGTKIKAPKCAPQLQNNPLAQMPPIQIRSGLSYPLITPNCDLDNTVIKMQFSLTEDNQAKVSIIQRKKPSVILGGAPKPVIDELLSEEFIDLNSQTDRYTGTYRFVSNQSSGKSEINNTIIVCDYELAYDQNQKKLTIFNWDYDRGYYVTCIYSQNAQIRFFPK